MPSFVGIGRVGQCILQQCDILVKETAAVVIVSVILGIIIAAVDVGVKNGFDKLLQLG